MPLTLMLTPTPRLRTFAPQEPFWRTVLRLADQAAGRIATLWGTLFADVRQAMRRAPLEHIIQEAPTVLEVGMRISQLWEQTVEVPARQLLPVLGTEVVNQVGHAAVTTATETLGVPPTAFVPGLPAATEWVQQYTGAQIRDITDTTRTAVRQVLQDGWRAGKHPRALARDLRQVIGLTSRQHQAIERQVAQMQAQGKTAAQVQRARDQLTQRALRYRTETVSLTESLSFSNHGAYEALRQSVLRGYVEEQRVRRFWVLTPGACEDCVALASTYSEGVGLYQPFGDVLHPPLHPRCRCAATVRIV